MECKSNITGREETEPAGFLKELIYKYLNSNVEMYARGTV